MYRLKVKVNKTRWMSGIITYNTYLEAQIRQEELKLVGIKSIIINSDASKIIEH